MESKIILADEAEESLRLVDYQLSRKEPQPERERKFDKITVIESLKSRKRDLSFQLDLYKEIRADLESQGLKDSAMTAAQLAGEIRTAIWKLDKILPHLEKDL